MLTSGVIHLPDLIQDLAFILITAAFVTLVFKKLGQPVVLGYLIAGFLLSPHVPLLPSITDLNSVKVWAEIGVIILLFGLGLEFSFKKLTQVGRSASIIAIFEVVFMLAIGFVAGQALGWSKMDSLFLGGILSISSTTIIVRAFDELGLKGRRFVSLVFGVLIVEDIAAILLLVLLSTVAISQTLSGTELVASSLKLGFFLVLWFIMGIYLLPPLLKRIRGLLNNETTLVISLGLCLLMVLIATKVGFSPALGAFVMGSLLAETKEGARIEHLIHPVRDLFAAVFFVSVGMLIDPKVLLEYGPEVLLITGITIIGKLLSSGIGALISGASLRHSVQTGMSLAQIGEFSFIIATLGLTLKVTSEFLYPIAVAVSAITTFTTPYLIKFSTPFYNWLEGKLPKGFLLGIERYQTAVQTEGGRTGFTALVWKAYGWRILLNSIMALSVFLLSVNFLRDLIDKISPATQDMHAALLAVMSALIALPFFWAIAFGKSSVKLNDVELMRIHRLSWGLQVGRSSYAALLAGFSINLLVPLESGVGLTTLAGLSSLVLGGRLSEAIYRRLEGRFIRNLSSKDTGDADGRRAIPNLTPWDAGLADFVVNPNSPMVGCTLQQSRLKERFGVTVALVERGEERLVAPDRNFVMMPHDRVFIVGSDEQLALTRDELEKTKPMMQDPAAIESFGLSAIRLTGESPFVGKILRESGLREAISGLVIGIERAGERILSPDSSLSLRADDLLWVVGDIERIKSVRGKSRAQTL